MLSPFSFRNRNSSSSTKQISSSPCTLFRLFLWALSAQSHAVSSIFLGLMFFHYILHSVVCTCMTWKIVIKDEILGPVAFASQPCFCIPTTLPVKSGFPLSPPFDRNLNLLEISVSLQKGLQFGSLGSHVCIYVKCTWPWTVFLTSLCENASNQDAPRISLIQVHGLLRTFEWSIGSRFEIAVHPQYMCNKHTGFVDR